MKVAVYRVSTGAEESQIIGWHLRRRDAIEAAAILPAGEYHIHEGTFEADSWVGCVLSALNRQFRMMPTAVVTVAADGTATVTETLTRAVKRGGA